MTIKKTFLILGQAKSEEILSIAMGEGYEIENIEDPYMLKAEIIKNNETILYLNISICNEIIIEKYLKLKEYNTKLKFIIHADSQQKVQKYIQKSDIWFVRHEDFNRFSVMFKNLIVNQKNHHRFFKRAQVQSQVFVTDGSNRVVRGVFADFTSQGALLLTQNFQLRDKEFISVSYLDINQQWVKMMTQVRWQKVLISGDQKVGLKFLAFA